MRRTSGTIFDFCVLITCFNHEQRLIRSLQSIHYHPKRYFVLIVDDGSAIPLSQARLIEQIPDPPEIVILRLPTNGGITRALNEGLTYLSGTNHEGLTYPKYTARYIARLDCGDLCMKDRFIKQVEFLDRHPDIDLLGTRCIFKDFLSGDSYKYLAPPDHDQIMRQMHFKNVFIHPTVMWRASVTRRLPAYPDTYPHAEDYAYFFEMLQQGRAAILPEYLVISEINPGGISITFRRQQLKSRIDVVRKYGHSRLYGIMGELRLRLWMLVPAAWALKIKKWILFVKPIQHPS
jgi:glycosyltransferase involved in cell wall biosynthesis